MNGSEDCDSGRARLLPSKRANGPGVPPAWAAAQRRPRKRRHPDHPARIYIRQPGQRPNRWHHREANGRAVGPRCDFWGNANPGHRFAPARAIGTAGPLGRNRPRVHVEQTGQRPIRSPSLGCSAAEAQVKAPINNSVPHIPFINVEFMFTAQHSKFVLKALLSVMQLLLFDVFDDLIQT